MRGKPFQKGHDARRAPGFLPGPDARRHALTPEERELGGVSRSLQRRAVSPADRPRVIASCVAWWRAQFPGEELPQSLRLELEVNAEVK